MSGYGGVINIVSANCIFMFSQSITETAFSPANIKNIRTGAGEAIDDVGSVTINEIINFISFLCFKVCKIFDLGNWSSGDNS